MGQTASVTLTFNSTDRYFYIDGKVPFPRDDDSPGTWQIVSSQFYRTSSLRAAARFRPYADETCEKVFDRAFNVERIVPPLPPLDFLDPHQVEGVRWILSRRRSYLAHAPGAGKTAQAIVAGCLIKGQGQIVLIVPPDLTKNWEREIQKFTDNFRAYYTVGVVGTAATKKSVAWGADYLIVPDSMLAKPWVYSELRKRKIKLLAVDEGSRFKEPTSLRTKALFGGVVKTGPTSTKTYAGIYQQAHYVVLLDGSPMPNRAMELWAPVYALDPEAIDCMDQQDYGFRFCGAQMNERGVWEFKHSSNEKELRGRLRQRLMHVVTEAELDHPERRRSMLIMNQDKRTSSMKAWERKNLKLLKTTELSEDLSQGEMATHRRRLGEAKVDWTIRYILGRLNDRHEKILLFGWHRDVTRLLAHGIGQKIGQDCVGLVLGGTPNSERESLFARFQNGNLRIIVGNIAAMGRGHNLQRADRVVFCEPSWSDELNKQCEKRTSRRGNDAKFVPCEYVVLPDSLDERVMQSLFAKEARVKKVIG